MWQVTVPRCVTPLLSHWTWVYVEASSNLYVIGHCPKVSHSSFVSLDMGICRGKLQLICDRSLSQGGHSSCHSSFVSLDMGICRGKLQLICDRSQGVSPHLSQDMGIWVTTYMWLTLSHCLIDMGICRGHCPSSNMGICRGKLCDRSLSQGVSLLICLIGHG